MKKILIIINSLLIIILLIGCGSVNNTQVSSDVPFYDWIKVDGSPQNDEATGLAADLSGNIYIVGYSEGDFGNVISKGNHDIIVAKYSSNGEFIWSNSFASGAGGEGYDIAIDNNSNVYITGGTFGSSSGNMNSGGADIVVAKFDSNGNYIWSKLIGTAQNDVGNGIDLDANGNIYLTGYTYGNLNGNINVGACDLFVEKLDNSGNEIWTKTIATSLVDEGCDIKYSSPNELVVVGHTRTTINNDFATTTHNSLIAKFDLDGNQLWMKVVSSLEDGYALRLAISDDDFIYFTGTTSGSLFGNLNSGEYDSFLAKFNMSGEKIWFKQFGSSGFDQGQAIAIDSSGKIIVASITQGNIGSYVNKGSSDLMISAFNKNGNLEWYKLLGTNEADSGRGLVKYNNKMLLGGFTGGNLEGISNHGNDDIFLMQF